MPAVESDTHLRRLSRHYVWLQILPGQVQLYMLHEGSDWCTWLTNRHHEIVFSFSRRVYFAQRYLVIPYTITIGCIFYRAMLAQSAVMRLHVVRPSVCPSVCP